MEQSIIHPLRAIREEWNLSQEQLAEETGLSERTIIRAEQGSNIYPSSRKILCTFFGKSARELGLLHTGGVKTERQVRDDAMDRLRRKLIKGTATIAGVALALPHTDIDLVERVTKTLLKPSYIDQITLTHLKTQMPGYWQLVPDIAGSSSPTLLGLVERQLSTIMGFLAAPQQTGDERELWVLAGELAQIGGQMAFDMHNHPLAAAYYRAAIHAGQQAGHHALMAVALTRMSFLPTYDKRPDLALPYQQEARQLAQSATPTMQAWIAVVEAEAQASLHNTLNCHRAIERAEAVGVPAPTEETDPYRTGFDLAKLNGYKGACYLRIQQPEQALHALKQSLSLIEGTSRLRYRSIILTDIARAYGQQRAPEAAQPYIREALTITGFAHSWNRKLE